MNIDIHQFDSIPEDQASFASSEPGANPALRLVRYSHGYGFAAPPSGTPFEQMELAPPDDQYKLIPTMEMRPGIAFYQRVQGIHGNLGYGKLTVDEVTVKKPQGVKILYNWVH